MNIRDKITTALHQSYLGMPAKIAQLNYEAVVLDQLYNEYFLYDKEYTDDEARKIFDVAIEKLDCEIDRHTKKAKEILDILDWIEDDEKYFDKERQRLDEDRAAAHAIVHRVILEQYYLKFFNCVYK